MKSIRMATKRRKSMNVSFNCSHPSINQNIRLTFISRTVNCGRKSLGDDAYYCNKELVELLVFDAKVTNESYQSWSFKSEREQNIVETYNATVRFVGTMSGE